MGHALVINNALYSTVDESSLFPSKRPKLAHYTTLQNLENIVSSQQLWLSNPLFMNDYEEVAFGVHHALGRVKKHSRLVSLIGSESLAHFDECLNKQYSAFGEFWINDLYVTSFSLVSEQNEEDGLLSMWRGYGDDGKGVALVFDTTKFPTFAGIHPLVLAPIEYLAVAERDNRVDRILDALSNVLAGGVDITQNIELIADLLFQRIWVGAVFSKHIGFREENEWRLAFLPERNNGKEFDSMFGYLNGPEGIVPKLKLKLGGRDSVLGASSQIEDVIDKILLGPGAAKSPVNANSVRRMLAAQGCKRLPERVARSTIPYRSQS